MGNPNENALPECQLSCLQEMVNTLYLQQYGAGNDALDRPVGFWMDTLCIPVHPDDVQYRKQTIRQMRNIYKSAILVLVLDSWIRELPRSANIIEKAARLYLSNWQHRLWTLQEGVLAQGLFFQFNDGSQALRHLWQEQEIHKKTCPGFYSTIVDYTLPLVPMSNPKLKNEGEKSTLEEKFPALVEGIVNRKTSKLADETICFATLLDLDPGFLLREDENKRMETFLRKIGAFQQGLIFNELRRLQTDGFRWAPRSFLSQAKPLWPKLNAELSKRDRDNYLAYGVLRYRGGLLVRFPGIKLLCRGSHLKNMMALVPRNDGTVRYGAFLVKEDDVESGKRQSLPRWDPACQYAIVSSTLVCKGGGETMCIFGMLRGQDDEGVLAIEYLCRAIVKPLSNVKLGRTTEVRATISKYGALFEGDAEEYGEDCLIAADWLAEDQEWCVM